MTQEVLKLALEMVQNKMYAHAEMYLKEALAQPKPVAELIYRSEGSAGPPRRFEAQPEQWGASAVTHPEYVAEQKRKTEELRSMLELPVQVSPLEFVTMTLEKEHLIGKPIFWAEWPNREQGGV